MAACCTSLLLLTLIHLILRISARDFLSAGSSLSIEHNSDVLHSRDGTFSCGFYNISPNASTFSIWFSKSSERTVVWSANPLHPVYTWGSRVKLHTDGSMVLKDYNGQIVWTSNASVSNGEHIEARLLDTGNLIVKGKGSTILWQSFDSPTDTLLPTQNITATKRLVSTNRLLDPGHYSFHFDDQYLLSLFYDQKDITLIYWPNPATTIWEKLRKPFNSTTTGAFDSWGHFLGSDNATFTAADWGPGIMRRLTLDYDGNLRLYSLNKADGRWSVTWMAFPLLCNVRGLCGTYGICVYTPVPACACAPGFEVVDPSDRSKGCRQKINISCDPQDVKFSKLPHTDFYGNDMSVHRFVSLAFCKNICLKNCQCKGFAYWEGLGDCYPKSALHGGVTLRNFGSTGTMYIKIHKGVQVLESLVPKSQPFGPKFGPDCRSTNKYVTADFLDTLKSSQSEAKYLYFYGFLSAAALAEVLFFVLGWFMLRRERGQLRGVWPAEDGYEMITNHFRRYTYRELVTATRKFKDELGRGASGIVYKGVLKDNREVAVKKLQDINQGPHRILVSEYIENGSLDKTLFGKGKTVTAFTYTDDPAAPPPPPPPEPVMIHPAVAGVRRSRSRRVLSARRVGALVLVLGALAVAAYYCFYSDVAVQFLGMEQEEAQRNETRSFLLRLYPKARQGRALREVGDVKLAASMVDKDGGWKARRKMNVEKATANSTALLPIRGNVFPDGQYYTSIFVGNPPRPYFLDVDTGSDLTWIQCDAPCTNCAKGPHPLYKPAKEKIVPPKDLLCQELQGNQNYYEASKQCDYEIEYADQSSSMGVLARDDMYLIPTNGGWEKLDFVFGCAYDQQGQLLSSPAKTDGILGLSSAAISLPSQLAGQGLIANVFGHCITRETGGGGYMFLGDDYVPRWGMTWTSTRNGPDNLYRTAVQNVKYGDQHLSMREVTGNSVHVIFDSGSSYTYLPSEIYGNLIAAIKYAAPGFVQDNSDRTLPLCWNAGFPVRYLGDIIQFFKPLNLHFGKKWLFMSKTFTISPEDYIIISDKGNVCLGLLNGTEINLGSNIVVGDVSLRGKLVVYDNQRRQIGWANSDCSKPQTQKGFPFFI